MIRLVKISFIAFFAVFALLTGVDNVFDYRTNFDVVRHVLSMDTTFPGNKLMGRAVTSETLHHLAYWLIIVTELAYGAVLVFGAFRLYSERTASAAAFNAAKAPAVLGLAIGFALYFFGFLTVGGEWFQMWQSPTWNMQEAAFRFLASIGLVLLFVIQPDAD